MPTIQEPGSVRLVVGPWSGFSRAIYVMRDVANNREFLTQEGWQTRNINASPEPLLVFDIMDTKPFEELAATLGMSLQTKDTADVAFIKAEVSWLSTQLEKFIDYNTRNRSSRLS